VIVPQIKPFRSTSFSIHYLCINPTTRRCTFWVPTASLKKHKCIKIITVCFLEKRLTTFFIF
jgi:hypothetical protein